MQWPTPSATNRGRAASERMPLPSTVPYALVVDDDAIILMDAASILEEAGFRTLTAMNARDALASLETHADSVTVLFTDVEMPGDMDGFGLARETSKRWPDVVILVASGNRQPVAKDMPEGSTFLGKPFSAELVRARLQEMLPDGVKPEPLRRAS